jgi:hypothetical protein
MGRREQRAELESTWSTYEPREAGVPFRTKDIVDADERESAERAPTEAGAAAVGATLDAQAARHRDLASAIPRRLIALGAKR